MEVHLRRHFRGFRTQSSIGAYIIPAGTEYDGPQLEMLELELPRRKQAAGENRKTGKQGSLDWKLWNYMPHLHHPSPLLNMQVLPYLGRYLPN